MKMNRIGNSGLKVSELCLGCMSFGDPERGGHPWTLPKDQSAPLIRQAYEAGINFFDTANVETMEAMHDVVKSGKARYIGASTMWAWQFAKAQEVARANGWTPFISMQSQISLLYREEEREMIPLCLDQGVGLIPWSPIARGVLAGNRSRSGERRTTRAGSDQFADYLYAQPTDFDVVDRVVEVAGERSVPPAQVALAWLLHKPGLTAPTVGAT